MRRRKAPRLQSRQARRPACNQPGRTFAGCRSAKALDRHGRFLLAPAPLLIAGLGWGWVVALIAGVIGALALSLAIGWAFAVPYLLATALPAAIISRLALQQRPGLAD